MKELKKRQFFKRFAEKDIAKALPGMTVKQHKYGQFIFPDNNVAVILAGSVEVNHHADTVSKAGLIGKFSAGDIIGFELGDGGITCNVEAWIKCISNVEAIWMSSADFAELWANQQKYERRIFYESLKLQKMFQQFSEQTLHMLAFELLEQRSFQYGEVILYQHKRSALNRNHWQFNKPQENAMMQSLRLHGKNEIDQTNFVATFKQILLRIKSGMAKALTGRQRYQAAEMLWKIKLLEMRRKSRVE